MKRANYVVHLPLDHVAKFSDYNEAIIFARMRSQYGTLVEVSDKTGLIGQFVRGKATAEFAHLNVAEPIGRRA